MVEDWFSPLADELAQCLLDARACAQACEELLDAARDGLDAGGQRRLLDALVPAVAIAQVMIELLDRPQQLVLAAALVCRDTTRKAADDLGALELSLDTVTATAALRTAAESSAALLEAAGY